MKAWPSFTDTSVVKTYRRARVEKQRISRIRAFLKSVVSQQVAGPLAAVRDLLKPIQIANTGAQPVIAAKEPRVSRHRGGGAEIDGRVIVGGVLAIQRSSASWRQCSVAEGIRNSPPSPLPRASSRQGHNSADFTSSIRPLVEQALQPVT